MILKSRPRRRARMLVDVLVGLLLDTEVEWKPTDTGLVLGSCKVWDGCDPVVSGSNVSLPFLQSWRLDRAIKTRIAFEAIKTIAEQINKGG